MYGELIHYKVFDIIENLIPKHWSYLALWLYTVKLYCCVSKRLYSDKINFFMCYLGATSSTLDLSRGGSLISRDVNLFILLAIFGKKITRCLMTKLSP